MSKLTITAKGQVTFRQDILRHLGVRPGEKVDLEKLPGGRVELKAAQTKGRISDVFNLLKTPNRPSLSIDEINELAAEGWIGKR
jgi:bifunctional DNA-binding transcriptional regulator/antitoxin component of YhaV-PrlF toxin-antitoxin module